MCVENSWKMSERASELEWEKEKTQPLQQRQQTGIRSVHTHTAIYN